MDVLCEPPGMPQRFVLDSGRTKPLRAIIRSQDSSLAFTIFSCSPSCFPSSLPVAGTAIPEEFLKACTDIETVSITTSGSSVMSGILEESGSSSGDATNGSSFSSPEVTSGPENEAK